MSSLQKKNIKTVTKQRKITNKQFKKRMSATDARDSRSIYRV